MSTSTPTLETRAASDPSATASTTPWIPCRWNEELHGCIFLPRMIQKGRRQLETERTGRDHMNGFLFGDVEYADKQVLTFLHTNEARVRQLLASHKEDDTVAMQLIRESGRTPEELRDWNERFRRKNAPFTPMWDADEGRRAPGLGTSLLSFFYNYIMMPPVYLLFRIQNTMHRRKMQGRAS